MSEPSAPFGDRGRRVARVGASALPVPIRLRLARDGAVSVLVQPAEFIEIPNECGVLVATLAVGNYSDEADPGAGRRHRRWTNVGALLNAAKYHAGTLSSDDALAALSSRLVRAAQIYPACSDAGAVIATPGSGTLVESFSERLAKDVALGVGLPLISVRSRLGPRSAAKRKHAKRAGDYVIDTDLSGMRVLVVDDVFETGTTLSAVAQAALEAGAEVCVGLVAARRLPTDETWVIYPTDS